MSTKRTRKARKPGTSGKSLETAVAMPNGVIVFTKIPNGVQFKTGGDFFYTKSPPDFAGTVVGSGRAVWLDAKRCGLVRAFNPSTSALKQHQVDALVRHGRAGAVAGLLIEATEWDTYYWLDWTRLADLTETFRPVFRWGDLPDLGAATHTIDWRRVLAVAAPAGEARHA